jgi:uncharacterized protein YndB with AHSA1/START domain
MSATAFSYGLARRVVIQADPATVYSFFEDSARWASWWGAGSTIEPRVHGRVLIRHPGGVEVTGEILTFEPPTALAFTYAYVGRSGAHSVVSIRLEPAPGGATALHLDHSFSDEAMRDEHVQGWRYQLAVFANLVADHGAGELVQRVDGWFAAWSEPDGGARDAALERLVTSGIRFRDRFSLVEGLDDLRPHLAAVHRFMPGMRLSREGDVRHCQGTVLADWMARAADGTERGRGTSVFVLGEGRRIAEVTGFWTIPARG